MIGFSWLQSKFVGIARNRYNQKKYSSSARFSRLVTIFSSDSRALDILARSLIRKKKFKNALRVYKRAEKKGLLLRDHQDNKFKAAIKSGNFIDAFKAMSASRSSGKPHRSKISQMHKSLAKLESEERTQIVLQFSEIADVPSKILSLSDINTGSISRIDLDPGTYTTLNPEILKTKRYIRDALSIRQSSSFIISKVVTDSLRSPLKLITLPFSLLRTAYLLKSDKKFTPQGDVFFPEMGRINPESRRDCVVFFPTNGVGFGHYTRTLAIAKKLKKTNPDSEIVIFTTMPTLSAASNLGFITYHLPSRYKFRNMEPREWNVLLEELLGIVFTLHRPKMFIFDGAYPYRGMLNSISSQSRMLKCWIRRGGEKSKSNSIPEDSVSKFDTLILPGDTVPNPSDGYGVGKSLVRVNPILLVDKEETLPKGSLKAKIGCPEEAKLCYVQLGAGRINEIGSEIELTIQALLEVPGVVILIGESMLGERIDYSHPRVRILREYPNAYYYKDIDFSIIAGGYNSFHEMIEHSIPSICYPNMNTGRDDQLARCLVARDAGCMMVVRNRTRKSITASIKRISNNKIRDQMRVNCSILHRPNGASEVSDWISGLI
jgi:hypothetical protein